MEVYIGNFRCDSCGGTSFIVTPGDIKKWTCPLCGDSDGLNGPVEFVYKDTIDEGIEKIEKYFLEYLKEVLDPKQVVKDKWYTLRDEIADLARKENIIEIAKQIEELEEAFHKWEEKLEEK